MIKMKNKLVTTLTVFLIASIVLSSYATFAAAAPKEDKENNGKSLQAQNHQPNENSQKKYNTFEMVKLTGTAITTNIAGEDEEVDVTLSIEGNANGKEKTVFHIRTQGGEATVTGYEAISATKGQGIIVNKCDFIHLNIMMSAEYYGGRSTVWILRGTTGDLTGDTLPVHLESRRVVLPQEGYPQLRNLKLDGTITFS